MFKVRDVIILTAVMVLVLGCLIFGLPDQEQNRETFEKTVALAAGGSFSLENVNGGVNVSSWKENKVEIKAVKKTSKSEAELKKVQILVDEAPGSVTVKAVWPKFPERAKVSVDFEIKVPEGTVLRKVETVNGGIEISGSYVSAAAETTNGRIGLKDVTGDCRIETTNGGIEVSGLDGGLQAETTNGGIRIEGLTFRKEVRAETTNGGITLGIRDPGKVNADLEAETTNGGIEVGFPVVLKKSSRRHIEARLGSGGPAIRLETVNGGIRITD